MPLHEFRPPQLTDQTNDVKKTRLRKRSNSERAKLIARIDSVHGWIVRNSGPCVITGEQATDCSHLFVRSRFKTRWDISEDGNCHPMSRRAHNDHHNGSGNYKAWYIRKFGEDRYYALMRLSNLIYNPTQSELGELLDKLELIKKGMANEIHSDER